MKEVYRSFEGLLTVENPSGYIISEGENFYEVEHFHIASDAKKSMCRIDKNYITPEDFCNIEKIGRIHMDIDNGCYNNKNMQVFYKGKWYSGKLINKIQNDNNTYNWKNCV